MSDVLGYRLVKRKWSASAFDGEGARRYGGRWNSKGTLCVYIAESPALAVLEVLVHVLKNEVMQAYDLFELKIPSKLVLRTNLQGLPANWKDEPAPQETAAFGDDWLNSASSLALAVPSVIVPRSWNYLLNNRHPAFEQVISNALRIEFNLDQRLVT